MPTASVTPAPLILNFNQFCIVSEHFEHSSFFSPSTASQTQSRAWVPNKRSRPIWEKNRGQVEKKGDKDEKRKKIEAGKEGNREGGKEGK